MKVTVYTQNGKETKKTAELADSIFGVEIREDLVAQAVYTYQMNQRQGTRRTKPRSEVSGGGRKPYAQKTADRARHGSIRSPIFIGGGHAHAIIPKNWRKRLPLKMKRLAIFSALSYKLNEGLLKVVDKIEVKEKGLTKQVEELASRLASGQKLLIVQGGYNKPLLLGARSLKKVDVVLASEFNMMDVLSHEVVVILEDAVEKINKMWGGKGSTMKDKRSKSKETAEAKTKEAAKAAGGIEELGLSARAGNALKDAGIDAKQLKEMSKEELIEIKGIGEKAAETILKKLK